ncbi:MAG: hypothetical protein K2O17_02070 [Bacteroidaceae bacterium]|nr:hypothetical protein [Bacteroidaceae bacterium]
MKKTTLSIILISVLAIGILISVFSVFVNRYIIEVDYVSEQELIRNLEKANKGDAEAMWYLTKRYKLYFEEDSAKFWAQKAYDAGNKKVAIYVEVDCENIDWELRGYEGLFNNDYFYYTISMGEYNGRPIDIPYLKRWAQKGLPHAIWLHTLYLLGSSADYPISEEAWQFLINGARKGVAELQRLVQHIYENEGERYPEAIDWLYLTANNKKNCNVRSYSQRILARIYFNGDTVLNIKPDIPLAMYWMNRIIETSNEEFDVDCAKYNYLQCVEKGYIAAKEDNTPYNKNPSGKYIWDKNKSTPEPVPYSDDYLDSIYKAVEEQDTVEVDEIPRISAEDLDYYRRHYL